jgi:hypothetical protein
MAQQMFWHRLDCASTAPRIPRHLHAAPQLRLDCALLARQLRLILSWRFKIYN